MSDTSAQAEEMVVGACMIDNGVIGSLTDLIQPSDFSNGKLGMLFDCIGRVDARGEAVDLVSVGEEVERSGKRCDLTYLLELSQSVPGTANVQRYAEVVQEQSRRRTLLQTLNDLAVRVSTDRTADAEQLAAEAAGAIASMQRTDSTGLRNTHAVLKSLAQQWDRRMSSNGAIDGLETGLHALDQRFNGWKPGDLVVIAGRPSMGKSALGLQICVHNTVNKPGRALIFSLEMTAEKLLERAMANVARVHLDVFRKADAAAWGRHSANISMAAEKIKSAGLLIDDTPGLHINQILARARAQHRRDPLSLVMIDHINITHATGQNREREVAMITGSIKALAKELGCPVVALSQLNRGVESRADKRPVMSDLRESGSIEQDADIVMLLYRDEYYHENSNSKGVVEVITGKFREGETGKDYCAGMLHMGRFEDLSPEYTFPEPEEETFDRGFRFGRGRT